MSFKYVGRKAVGGETSTGSSKKACPARADKHDGGYRREEMRLEK